MLTRSKTRALEALQEERRNIQPISHRRLRPRIPEALEEEELVFSLLLMEKERRKWLETARFLSQLSTDKKKN